MLAPMTLWSAPAERQRRFSSPEALQKPGDYEKAGATLRFAPALHI